MAGFQYTSPTVSAADLAGGGPAGVANTIANTAVQNVQATQLMPAQAQLAGAQSAEATQRAAGLSISNQASQIDLNNRINAMQAQRKNIAEMLGLTSPVSQPTDNTTSTVNPQGPSPSTPAAAMGPGGALPTPTTQVVNGNNTPAPTNTGNTQVAPIDSGQPQNVNGSATKTAATNVDKTDAKAVQQHVATMPFNTQGLPNLLNTDLINKNAHDMLAAGVEPAYVQQYQQTSITAQADMAKKFADTNKAQQDAKISTETANQDHLDTINDYANQAVINYKSNPGAARAYANAVGIDIDSPKGMDQLISMANASPKGMAMQEQANKNKDTASQIAYRTAEIGIQRGQLAVSQGNMSRENLVAASNAATGAAASANVINNSRQLEDDLTTASHFVGPNADTPLQKNGTGYYVATQNLDQNFLSNLLKSGAKQDPNNAKIVYVDNILHRIDGGVSELKRQQLATGGVSASTDTAAKTVHDAITGNGLDITKPNAVISDSLNYIHNFAKSSEASADVANANANKVTQQLGTVNSAGPNGTTVKTPLFQPIVPQYKRQNIQKGEIVGGHVYLGGDPSLSTSWRQ